MTLEELEKEIEERAKEEEEKEKQKEQKEKEEKEKDALRDTLLKLHQEWWAQARDTKSSNSYCLSGHFGRVIGLAMADRNLSRADLPATLFLTAVGIFGAISAWKYVELVERYQMQAVFHRRALDNLFENSPLRLHGGKNQFDVHRSSPCGRRGVRRFMQSPFLIDEH